MNELAVKKPSAACREYRLNYTCLIWWVIVLLLSACTTFHVSPDDFMGHVEDVFRRQNQAIGEVMILTEEDIDPASYEQLMGAEKEMLEACEPLNEYAVLKRDGLDTGFFLYQQAIYSAEECEESTGEMEAILEKISAEDKVDHASSRLPDEL